MGKFILSCMVMLMASAFLFASDASSNQQQNLNAASLSKEVAGQIQNEKTADIQFVEKYNSKADANVCKEVNTLLADKKIAETDTQSRQLQGSSDEDIFLVVLLIVLLVATTGYYVGTY